MFVEDPDESVLCIGAGAPRLHDSQRRSDVSLGNQDDRAGFRVGDVGVDPGFDKRVGRLYRVLHRLEIVEIPLDAAQAPLTSSGRQVPSHLRNLDPMRTLA